MVPRNKGTMKNTSIDLYLWEEISQSLFRLGKLQHGPLGNFITVVLFLLGMFTLTFAVTHLHLHSEHVIHHS